MTIPHRHQLTALGLSVVAAAFAVLAQSLWWSGDVPLVVKLATAGIGILAFFRPADALLIVAALTPLTRVLGVTIWPSEQPLHLTEAVALVFLSGALLREARCRLDPALTLPIHTAVVVFAAVVLTSCLVLTIVVQVWHDYPWPFYQRLGAFLVRDYLVSTPDFRPWGAWPAGLGFVSTAALLLEGIALLVATSMLVRRDPTLVVRLAKMLVAGAVGAALLSLSDFAADLVRGATLESIQDTLVHAGWARHVRKVNVAGSHFVLLALVALGLSFDRARQRPVWTAATGVIIAALVLTGSRTALLAFGAVLTPLVARALLPAMRRLRLAPALTLVVLLVVVLGSIIERPPETEEPTPAAQSLRIRQAFADTSLRMWASEPAFGVGVGQYYPLFADFSGPELQKLYPRENAHNNFLQIGAELGAVGLGTFLWLVGSAVWGAWGYAQRHPGDVRVIACVGGVLAFLITCLAGHPLLFAEASYPFWIVLGILAGLPVAPNASPRVAPGLVRIRSIGFRPGRLALAVLLAGIAASVPWRFAQHERNINYALVSYGFHRWETEPSGIRYRWTSDRSTDFVPAGAHRVSLSMQALRTEHHSEFVVAISLDGRDVERIRLVDGQWRQIQLAVPISTSGRPHRLDFRVSPSWTPAAVIPHSTDERRLGVKVSELDVTMG